MHFRRLLIPPLIAAISCNLPLTISEPSATAFPSETPAPAATPAPESTPIQTVPPPSATPEFVPGLPEPVSYQWSPVAEGFLKPVAIEHVGDDRLFIVEQRGVVWIIQNGERIEQPFLDIRGRVNSSAFEQGLLGLAFDPEFDRTGYFYVNYTAGGGDTIVSRFTTRIGESQADPASEAIVLQIDQPFANHNGGDLNFGPDGFLYIATGDGGSANDPQRHGQNLDSLLGKLLRIKVGEAEPYAIPGDNPFAASGGRPEVWAYGLRNPWRFSFDTATGDMYLGDVGQNSWEEIDFLPAGSAGGANFGWNLREGAHPFASQQTDGLIDPIAEYPNPAGGCSVTGGVVVRDPELPEWRGIYVYGDYCSGRVWGLVMDSTGRWQNAQLFDTPFNISTFGHGSDGKVYLADHNGRILSLEPIP